MANDISTGTMFSSSLPAWQRTYYEQQLLQTLRTKSILVPFTQMKEDFRARDTGVMNYSEVFDTDPDFNPLSEQDIWLRGAHLDSRSVNLTLEIHGDTLKFSDYSEVVQFIKKGDTRGLVREKIGQNMKDYLDILARNAFLSHPNPVYAGGTRANRAAIVATDLFDPDFGELARTHLEEAEVPGIAANSDDDIQIIACVTTPRVIHDIRTAAGSDWLEVHNYAGGVRKFSGEVGTWGGVRYIRTNRMVLRNGGAVVKQTALAAATVPGQGSAATVDTVYNVGQPNSTRYVEVTAVTDFAVGDTITISSKNVTASGEAPLETDGTIEHRRIVAIDVDNNRLTFERPLMKPHAADDWVTKGITLHGSVFMGGPAVAYGVGERPTPVFPPVIDDLGMIHRYGWRGYLKFQMFRPEFVEVHFTAGSTN